MGFNLCVYSVANQWIPDDLAAYIEMIPELSNSILIKSQISDRRRRLFSSDVNVDYIVTPLPKVPHQEVLGNLFLELA